MARRVLITGAAGFVGRTLARVLVRRGFSVSGLDLVPLRAERAADPKAESADFEQFACVDLLDEGALRRAPLAPDFDAVIHLAAVLSGAGRRALFGVNVGGTAAVLDRFVGPGCHFVLFSSGLVYGAQVGPCHEAMECAPTDPYAQSKLAAETLSRAHAKSERAALTVLRPSVLYGPGAPARMLLSALMESLRQREPFAMTCGEQLRDFLHVEDAASAVAAVLAGCEQGTWNLAYGESMTVRQAAELGAAIAGRPDLLRLGALPYRVGEVFDYRLDTGAVRRALRWRPEIPLRKGLEALWKEAVR